MSELLTKTAIAGRLESIERELRTLRAQLLSLEPRPRGKTGRKRPFTELYGIWKELGDISEEEIRKSEYRIPDDRSCQ